MYQKKPKWLKVPLRIGGEVASVHKLLNRLDLNTVCQEANCPNLMECFSKKTATFMILGKNCTRNCTFCNVTKGRVQPVDEEEPKRVAKAVEELNLKHVVITSVTRDDLADGGAGHFGNVIKAIRQRTPNVVVEVLIPDFAGKEEALQKVVAAKPEIINHNVETVPRLYSTVRPSAIYGRSLELLAKVKEMDSEILTKSGIMVGLGEEKEEVLGTLKDLREVNCDLLTIGQYLAPSTEHHPIVEFVHPDVFDEYGDKGREMGFLHVASAPLVRSSYNAQEVSAKYGTALAKTMEE